MTLKDVLRRHKASVCTHLAAHYSVFFNLYEMLLHSPNYVTRRQSLKVPITPPSRCLSAGSVWSVASLIVFFLCCQLLGEITLDRCNVSIMMRFISDAHNLRLVMTLLKDPSKTIQFEAFHVFKVGRDTGCGRRGGTRS